MTKRQLRLVTFWYTRQLDRWPFESPVCWPRPLVWPSALPAGAAAGEAADGQTSGPLLLGACLVDNGARKGPRADSAPLEPRRLTVGERGDGAGVATREPQNADPADGAQVGGAEIDYGHGWAA